MKLYDKYPELKGFDYAYSDLSSPNTVARFDEDHELKGVAVRPAMLGKVRAEIPEELRFEYGELDRQGVPNVNLPTLGYPRKAAAGGL